MHTGAGRIRRIRLRPLALCERGLIEPTVALSQLLSGERRSIHGESRLTLEDYADEIIGSGFPGIRPLPARARRAQLDGYLDMIVEREFADQGHPVRRPATLRRWLAAYAAATGTTASYTAILDAATPGDTDKPAKTTTIAYREVLSQLWLLDPVAGWLPSGHPLSRLAQAPKHHLADPGLAARLLGVDASALVSGVRPAAASRLAVSGSVLGRLFESLVTLGVRVCAQAAESSTFHLRTKNGDHEVDLIVQRDDGRVLAFEVKIGASVNDGDVIHLNWLQRMLGDQLLDAAVVTTGPTAYRRTDGIAVIPASLLGP
jgi:predicted AAA+ superfamily ATPase